jgi:predicted extracellular nuclease
MFVQEIQDDNGATNDAVVDANVTLSTLTSAIASAGGAQYSFVDIVPVDDQDGGQPGGNIRVAYLYNPAVIELVSPNPGSSTDAVQAVSSPNGPRLNFNPGRIAPSDSAWAASRKPLVAQWRFVSGSNTSTSASANRPSSASTFFTVNVHLTSKGGSTSLHGDPRPPLNGGVSQRQAQASLVANFTSSLLALDSNAKIIVAGDFNEFSFVQPLITFAEQSGLIEADVAAREPVTERYTYLFDMNSQQLDHMWVSRGVSRRNVRLEHVHVNTWVESGAEASDHDPSLIKVNLC